MRARAPSRLLHSEAYRLPTQTVLGACPAPASCAAPQPHAPQLAAALLLFALALQHRDPTITTCFHCQRRRRHRHCLYLGLLRRRACKQRRHQPPTPASCTERVRVRSHSARRRETLTAPCPMFTKSQVCHTSYRNTAHFSFSQTVSHFLVSHALSLSPFSLFFAFVYGKFYLLFKPAILNV